MSEKTSKTTIELDQETQKTLEFLSKKTGMKPEQIATEALQLFKKERMEPREKQKDFMKTLEKDIVEVKLTLYRPFYNFMKEYLAFFGDKKTIEDLCRMMVYENVKRLYEAFDEFVLSKISHIEEDSWPSKWHHIKIAIGPPEEEGESE